MSDSERNPLTALGILARLDLQNHDFQLLTDRQHILGQTRTLERQLTDVKHAFQTADIDERTVIHERRHAATNHHTRRQFLRSSSAWACAASSSSERRDTTMFSERPHSSKRVIRNWSFCPT
ncbi:MAG: hypothetical protein U0745_04455 [Polyangia bacterium]